MCELEKLTRAVAANLAAGGWTKWECQDCGAYHADQWYRPATAADVSGLVQALEPFFDGRAVHGSLPVIDGEWTPVVTMTVKLTEFDEARAALTEWRKNHG
jgi:hypothetical protein